MNKLWLGAGFLAWLLTGCSTVQQGHIPVVDSTSPASELEPSTGYGQGYATTQPRPVYQPEPQDSGVVVMVPTMPTVSAPLISTPITSSIEPQPSYEPAPEMISPMPTLPSGVPRDNVLAADEQLDGPVLALLTTASQLQNSGDLNGAASSLERAQRIAPREPQVLYRLAEVLLAQGNAAQAEQLARRGLSYAAGRSALQASLWELIAQSREYQGDAAGAAAARQNARVNL